MIIQKSLKSIKEIFQVNNLEIKKDFCSIVPFNHNNKCFSKKLKLIIKSFCIINEMTWSVQCWNRFELSIFSFLLYILVST